MKSALSLTLVVCLSGSSFSATAQGRTESLARPITESIAPEARRLAVEPEADQARPNRSQSDWSQIRTLLPGTEIVVTVSGASPAKRAILASDDTGMTVLNLVDSGLPAVARTSLRDMNTHNPERFLVTAHEVFVLDRNVRLESGGVFVADQKVADRQQIVQRIARSEIVQVKSSPAGRGAGTGAIVGAAVGVASGLGLASGLCDGSHCYVSGYVMFTAYLGAIGLGIGALLGELGHTAPVVIYRAP